MPVTFPRTPAPCTSTSRFLSQPDFNKNMTKIKGRLSLQLIKMYGGVEVQFHALTSALDAGERLASRPSRFAGGERAPCTQWIGYRLGPIASQDISEK
jgi:hypothetical protein